MDGHTLYGFEVEDLGYGDLALTASDAPARSTGWRDGYVYNTETGKLEHFDAEQNELFPCSAIRDLDLAVSAIDDEIRDEIDRAYEYDMTPLLGEEVPHWAR